MVAKKLTDEDERRVCDAYQAGSSSVELSTIFSVSKPIILKTLRKHGVERRSLSAAQRRYSLDEWKFSQRTPEGDYWLGFLMADGYVQLRPEKTIPNVCLSLSAIDENHLVKLRAFLSTDKPIYKYQVDGHDCVRLEICSKEISDQLQFYGVVPVKSHIAEAKHDLDQSRDFWRGVVDGDGCICLTGRHPRLRVVGSKPLMHQWLTFIKKHVHTEANVLPVHDVSKNGVRYITAYAVEIVGKKALPLINLLYSDAQIFLDRKGQLAAEALKRSC